MAYDGDKEYNNELNEGEKENELARQLKGIDFGEKEIEDKLGDHEENEEELADDGEEEFRNSNYFTKEDLTMNHNYSLFNPINLDDPVRLMKALYGTSNDPKEPDSETIEYALRWSCRRGKLKCIKALLTQGGVDLFGDYVLGYNPLHWVCCNAEEGNKNAAAYLIECANRKYKNGAKYLLACHTHLGDTPLHCAARGGSIYIIRLYVKSGANPYETDVMGLTPVEHAVSGSNAHWALRRAIADRELKF